MSPLSASDKASANEQFDPASRPNRRSNGVSNHENPDLQQFAAVIAQLKHENIASLASSIRQANETPDIESPSSSVIAPRTHCTVLPDPLYGSYNLAYRILFEDGVQWILKIPVNGHHACFDRLAAETLTSEALTMNMIKQTTSIPVPIVHDFDPSADNEIGCPYIMMDFLRGKPAWQGWFDEKASPSALEQFRARCLQTVAAAMVQLSQFAVDQSGSLRFDSDGRPVGFGGARVPDWLAEEEIMQGLKTANDGCLYCEKGPFTEPGLSFLYILNRRGSRDRDSLYTRGIHETVRLLTEWTLERDRSSNGSMRQFVLAHPDFALQNFLVEDDGTLCGVIDWDGVAAVPVSIGCLKYPDWLMSDWHPWYDYHPGVAGQRENSPEELATYRNMYAQFVEAFSSITCESTKVGKLHADITRRSLIAGTINLGAHDLKLTDDIVGNIFEKLDAITADYEDVDASDENLESTSGTGSDDVEEGKSSGKNESTEINEGIPGDGKGDNLNCLCSKCIAELAPNQPLPKILDGSRNGKNFSTEHSTCFDGPDLGTEHSLTRHSSGIHIQEVARDQSESASRKAKLAKWAFTLGEKGSKTIVKALHKKEGDANTSPRKVGMVKWALGMGGKCCKEASKVFHKQEASGPHSEDQPQAIPVQNDSQPVSKTVKIAITLCTRTEALLRKLIISLHQDDSSSNEGPCFQKTEVGRVQAFLESLVAVLKKLIQNQFEDDMGDLQTRTPTEGQISARYVLVNTEHCQRCNPGAGSQDHENPNDEMQSSEASSEEVWASIAAEVKEGGIPIELIQKQRDVIVQFLIQNLGNEMEQERELEKEKAAKKAKKAQKKAAMKEMNDASDLNSAALSGLESNNAEFRLGEAGKAERDATQSSIFEESAAKMRDEETGMTPQFPEDSTEGANGELCMNSSSIAKPEDTGKPSTTNVIGAAAEDNQVATEQPRYAKVGNLDNNHTSVEAMEPTDHKLRAMLANIQDLEPVNSNLQQEILRVAEIANGVSESENHSHISSFTDLSGTSPKSVAVRSKFIFKGGRWFETPRGSLRRVEDEASLHGSFYSDERISTSKSYISEHNGSSFSASAVGHRDKIAAKIPHLQPASTNHEEFKAINVFKVPDITEDDQGIDMGEFYNDENSGEFEDGEIDEEQDPSSLDIRLDREWNGPLSDVTGEEEVKNEPKAGEMVDNGYFTVGEVCVALAKGNLDERRMTRLREGFLALVNDTVGLHSRR